ncbi:MAG: 50S ribosomal protein L3 [candidate division NC10 bacterium]|nr:50S ribosomal protein L3 [candidate division NC10 bacterium]
MAIGLLGKKIGMTQVFGEGGKAIPVTVVEAGPCPVVQRKTKENDGYEAIQIGFLTAKPKKISKPLKGHFEKAGVPYSRHLREIRLDQPADFQVGQVLTVSLFAVGDHVQVTGTSIGKGFQGGVKRWGYKGGPESHGSMFHRAPGSIGASSFPSRVFKGHHMPGRMGGAQVTTKGLEVVKVDPARNLLLIKGAVPGPPGGLLTVKKVR